ncbi:BRCT domain-containing protein [Azotobacter beijerinckii]|uniref:BRCT domain-containing protein n=1 Tax=Azotobacter beijerinckii TaxID=170623 RepID=UPI000B834F4C|nr:BRCT domain-containing protein [Azotobacter beijerinckii]
MQPLKFIYQDAKGEVREWVIPRWTENTRYIQGRSEHDSLPRTFRKDRILEYLAGAEQLLFDLAEPAPEPAPRAQADSRPQILFTGFKSADRARLESKATEHGFRVMKNPGKSLVLLCIGYNAGPTKVEAARESGAFVVTEEQLDHLLLTGEVPC